MKKVKVLQIIDGSSYGGIFKLIHNISLNIKNIDMDLLTQSSIFNSDKKIYSLNIERKSLKNKIIYNYRLYKFLKKNKYDIVHINSGVFLYSFQMVLICRLAHIKNIIVHSHSTPKMNKVRVFLKTILNPLYRSLCVMYLSCSKKAEYSLFTKKFINKNKVIILKNGIDIDKFKFNKKIRDEYRKKFNIDKKIVYGHSGNFVYEKNHEYLIDLFYEIQKKQSNSILVLIGTGKLQNKIKDKVKSLGILDKVLFLGYREDVDKLLNMIDIFLFPSISEGLGVSVIESQTNGLITYSSNVIPEEANISPYFKFFNLNDDIKKIANRIVNENINVKSRVNGYKFIKENGYDIKDVCKELENIYLKLKD